MTGRDRTLLAGAAPRSSASAVQVLLTSFLPPALWFVHLNIVYLLVPPSCRWGHRWTFVAVTVAALGLMVPPTSRCLRAWRGDHGTDLVRFMGFFGVVLAALFGATTLLVGLSAAVVGPCR